MIFSRNPALLSALCRLVTFPKLCPIEFSPKSSRVNLTPHSEVRSKLMCYFTTFLVAAVAMQCLVNRSSSPMESVMTWLVMILLLASHSAIYDEGWRRSSEIVLFLNSLFQFDSMYPSSKDTVRSMSLKSKISIAFAYGILLSSFLMPAGYIHGLHWHNPCKPAMVGYWIIPECYLNSQGFNSIIGFGVKLLILLLNHWLWACTFQAGAFDASAIQSVGVVTIHEFVKRFTNKLPFGNILWVGG